MCKLGGEVEGKEGGGQKGKCIFQIWVLGRYSTHVTGTPVLPLGWPGLHWIFSDPQGSFRGLGFSFQVLCTVLDTVSYRVNQF